MQAVLHGRGGVSRSQAEIRTEAKRKLARRQAREEIISVSNRARRNTNQKPNTMRNLNEAVCAVRRRRLVTDEVLVTAGFNPGKAA